MAIQPHQAKRDWLLQQRDPQGRILITPRNYYDRFIKDKLGKSADSFQYHKLVVCPFHEDNDASLGTFSHHHLTGVEVYHCFGCGESGDVVRMHQQFERLKGRNLTIHTTLVELAKLYGLELPDLEETNDTLKKLDQTVKQGVYYNITQFNQDSQQIHRNPELTVTEKMQLLKGLMCYWKRKVKENRGRV